MNNRYNKDFFYRLSRAWRYLWCKHKSLNRTACSFNSSITIDRDKVELKMCPDCRHWVEYFPDSDYYQW